MDAAARAKEEQIKRLVRHQYRVVVNAANPDVRAQEIGTLKNLLSQTSGTVRDLGFGPTPDRNGYQFQSEDSSEFVSELINVLHEANPLACTSTTAVEGAAPPLRPMVPEVVQEKSIMLQIDETKAVPQRVSHLLADYQAGEVIPGVEFETVAGAKMHLPGRKRINVAVNADTREFVLSVRRHGFVAGGAARKIDNAIELDDIDIPIAVGGNRRFEATSFIVHIGHTPRGGHYVSYIKEGDQWFRYDDSNSYGRTGPINAAALNAAKAEAYVVKYSEWGRANLHPAVGQQAAQNLGNTCWANAAMAFVGSIQTFGPHVAPAPLNPADQAVLAAAKWKAPPPLAHTDPIRKATFRNYEDAIKVLRACFDGQYGVNADPIFKAYDIRDRADVEYNINGDIITKNGAPLDKSQLENEIQKIREIRRDAKCYDIKIVDTPTPPAPPPPGTWHAGAPHGPHGAAPMRPAAPAFDPAQIAETRARGDYWYHDTDIATITKAVDYVRGGGYLASGEGRKARILAVAQVGDDRLFVPNDRNTIANSERGIVVDCDPISFSTMTSAQRAKVFEDAVEVFWDKYRVADPAVKVGMFPAKILFPVNYYENNWVAAEITLRQEGTQITAEFAEYDAAEVQSEELSVGLQEEFKAAVAKKIVGIDLVNKAHTPIAIAGADGKPMQQDAATCGLLTAHALLSLRTRNAAQIWQGILAKTMDLRKADIALVAHLSQVGVVLPKEFDEFAKAQHLKKAKVPDFSQSKDQRIVELSGKLAAGLDSSKGDYDDELSDDLQEAIDRLRNYDNDILVEVLIHAHGGKNILEYAAGIVGVNPKALNVLHNLAVGAELNGYGGDDHDDITASTIISGDAQRAFVAAVRECEGVRRDIFDNGSTDPIEVDLYDDLEALLSDESHNYDGDYVVDVFNDLVRSAKPADAAEEEKRIRIVKSAIKTGLIVIEDDDITECLNPDLQAILKREKFFQTVKTGEILDFADGKRVDEILFAIGEKDAEGLTPDEAKEIARYRSVDGTTILHAAILNPDITAVSRILLSPKFADVDVNALDENNDHTPLMLAIRQNNKGAVKALLRYSRTDINFTNQYNISAADIIEELKKTPAVKAEYEEIIAMFDSRRAAYKPRVRLTADHTDDPSNPLLRVDGVRRNLPYTRITADDLSFQPCADGQQFKPSRSIGEAAEVAADWAPDDELFPKGNYVTLQGRLRDKFMPNVGNPTGAFQPYYANFGGIDFDESSGRRILGSAALFMGNFRGCTFNKVSFAGIPPQIFETIQFVGCTFTPDCKFPAGLKPNAIAAVNTGLKAEVAKVKGHIGDIQEGTWDRLQAALDDVRARRKAAIDGGMSPDDAKRTIQMAPVLPDSAFSGPARVIDTKDFNYGPGSGKSATLKRLPDTSPLTAAARRILAEKSKETHK